MEYPVVAYSEYERQTAPHVVSIYRDIYVILEIELLILDNIAERMGYLWSIMPCTNYVSIIILGCIPSLLFSWS